VPLLSAPITAAAISESIAERTSGLRWLPFPAAICAFGMPSDAHADLVAVQFWMNGCAQVAHISPAGLRRYRQELLATGAVMLT
jgi:hypothetical protein